MSRGGHRKNKRSQTQQTALPTLVSRRNNRLADSLGARASGFLATFGLAFPHEDGVVSDLHAASLRLTPHLLRAVGWSCATRIVVVGQEPRTSNMENTNRRPVKLRINLRFAANVLFCGSDRPGILLVADIRCPALRCVCVVPLAIILRRRTLGVEIPCSAFPPWVTYDCGHGRMMDRHKHIRLCVPLVPLSCHTNIVSLI